MTSNPRIHLLISILISTLILAGVWYVDRSELHYIEENDRIELSDFAQRSAARISAAVNIRLQLTQLLGAVVTTDEKFAADNFETISNALIGDMKGIMSLQLAPGGIVKFVTNLEQNKSIIGHDLLGDPDRRELAMQAISERRYIISGPLTLKQGGEAIIARLPIFKGAKNGNTGAFWGFATVLIDVPTLLKEASISVPDETVKIALRGKDGKGAEGAVFYGSADTFVDSAAVQLIVLPFGSWQIAIKRPGGLPTPIVGWRIWEALIGGMLAVLSGIGMFSILRRPATLQKAIDAATDELRLAKEEAESANRIKSEFLAVVSHELRTPLTSIKGSLSFVRGNGTGEMPDNAIEFLDIANRNTNQLINLVNDILDMEKIVSGNMGLDKRLLDFSDLVISSIDANKGYSEVHNVKFVLSNLAPNVSVLGDGRRLTQVIANLLSNAAKFSPENSVVDISVVCEESIVRVSVTDTGPGIPEKFKDHIFDKFTQVDSSDQREKGGTGLGLSISRSFIEAHDGEIGFESKEGLGSTFYFTLPLSE